MALTFIGVTDSELENEIQSYHTEALQILKVRFEHLLPVLNTLRVKFNHRLGVCLGRALADRRNPANSWIDLHYRAFKTTATALDRRSTYMHELAHIVANLHYKQQCGHSNRWKVIAMTLGDSGERCHTVDVSAFRPKRMPKVFTWACECRTFVLSQRRHNRALLHCAHYGKSGFYCPSCRNNLTLDATDLLKKT